MKNIQTLKAARQYIENLADNTPDKDLMVKYLNEEIQRIEGTAQ